MLPREFLIVQPWGRAPRQFLDARVVSSHRTAAAAYAALDAMAEPMAETGVAPWAVELAVVDEARRPVPRPGPL